MGREKGSQPSRACSQSRVAGWEMMSSTQSQPRPTQHVVRPLDTSLSWLLRQLGQEGEVGFQIDREAKACVTPRRNPQVERGRGGVWGRVGGLRRGGEGREKKFRPGETRRERANGLGEVGR